jgi:hypothetical protein
MFPRRNAMAELTATLWEHILKEVPGARLDRDRACDSRTSHCMVDYQEEAGFWFEETPDFEPIVRSFYEPRGWQVRRSGLSGFYVQTGEMNDLLVIFTGVGHILMSAGPV